MKYVVHIGTVDIPPAMVEDYVKSVKDYIAKSEFFLPSEKVIFFQNRGRCDISIDRL